MCCLGAEAHPPPASSPSARSSIRRHCLARFPPDPATLNLSRERFPFSCGRCEQNKLFDADRRAQALGDHHQRDHRPRHHRLRVPRRHLPNRSLRPRRRPPSPPATLAATALTAAAICASIHPRPCLRRRTPSPPLPARPSPLAPSSPPPPSPSYPSHCSKRSTISALPTMSPTMSFIVSSLLPSLWFKV